MKKLWEKIKLFFKGLWEKIKKWFNNTAIPWLKISWMQIVIIIVMFIVYDNTDSLPVVQTVAGLWLFLLLAYYLFWKLFGAEKAFKKKEVKPLPINPVNPVNPVPVKPVPQAPELVETVKTRTKATTAKSKK